MKKYGLFVHPDVNDPSFGNPSFGRLEPGGRIACSEEGHTLQRYLDNRKIIQELGRTCEMRWMNDFWYAASRIIRGDPLDRFDFLITNFPPRRDARELSVRRGNEINALAKGKSPEERKMIFTDFSRSDTDFTDMLYEQSFKSLGEIQANLPNLLVILYTGAPEYVRSKCRDLGVEVLHRDRYGLNVELGELKRNISKIHSTPELLEMLLQKKDIQFAAEALGNRKDTGVVPDLIELLNSSGLSPKQKEYIALALGDIGDVRAVDPLYAFLDDPGGLFIDYSSDFGVCRALRSIGLDKGREQVVQGAIAYLNERIMIDKRHFNWYHAAYVLGELRAEEGVDILVELICEDHPHSAKFFAIDALGKIASDKATEGLRECVKKGFGDVVKERVSQYKYLLKRNPALQEFR